MQSNGRNLGWRRHQDACGDYTTSEVSTNDDLMTRNSRTNISKREEYRHIIVSVLAECASQQDICRTQMTKVTLDFQHNQCKQ